MKTKNHVGFEPEIHPAFDCETDMKIREFAKWVSEKLPFHVSAFVLMVDREGYQTTPIVSHPNREGEDV